MIVKVESKDGNFKRLDDCNTVCFAQDNVEPDILDNKGAILNWILICTYPNDKNHTYLLDKGDTIYFMNGQGKTIDKIYV